MSKPIEPATEPATEEQHWTSEQFGLKAEEPWTDAELWWVDALELLDYFKDKERLTSLLRSDKELSPKVRDYLADLIERRCLPLDKHHKRIPAYHHSISPLNWHYLATHQKVDAYRQEGEGMSLDDAIQQAAIEEGLDAETLHLSYRGGHKSFREARKKRALEEKR